jgi:hypothetical protein
MASSGFKYGFLEEVGSWAGASFCKTPSATQGMAGAPQQWMMAIWLWITDRHMQRTCSLPFRHPHSHTAPVGTIQLFPIELY